MKIMTLMISMKKSWSRKSGVRRGSDSDENIIGHLFCQFYFWWLFYFGRETYCERRDDHTRKWISNSSAKTALDIEMQDNITSRSHDMSPHQWHRKTHIQRQFGKARDLLVTFCNDLLDGWKVWFTIIVTGISEHELLIQNKKGTSGHDEKEDKRTRTSKTNKRNQRIHTNHVEKMLHRSLA